MRTDGGPAFARPLGALGPEEWSNEQEGMSLRDWFAGHALVGCLFNETYDPFSSPRRQIELIARGCYAMADEMLKARDRSPDSPPG